MKNAKKSLALLLALVMIFGLGTIGASAAFNDAASIDPDYAMAVNVMAGMGILIGNENGDFNPTGNLTRAQAAKMVTYMMLGKETAERLPAKAMFNDVKATDWSAKYVYYLANKKIINGYGNGNFGPNDTVTAIQLAKMLLAAVGYGQADEFVGPGWDVAVFSIGVEKGLFTGTKATDYDVAATREEAALYVFNAMTSIPLMKYLREDGYYDYLYKDDDTFATTKYKYDTVEGVIVKTQADGNEYTVLNYEGSKTYNFNIDVSSKLVGHKVEIAYNTTEKSKDGVKYFNAYYVEDLSKEVSTYLAGYKAVYAAVGETNAKDFAYKDSTSTTPVEGFTYWLNNENCTYEANDIYESFDPSTYTMVITPGTYGSVISNMFKIDTLRDNSKLLKQSFYMTDGALIVDDDNIIIGYKANTYTVEKVTDIDTTAGAETITLSNSNDGDPISNSAKKDYIVEYDGIAKGDFVSVTQVGNVYTLTKCKLVENVHVDSLANDAPNYTINGTYQKTGAGISKIENVSPQVGGTYNLYLDKNGKYARVEKIKGGVTNATFVSYLYHVNPLIAGGVVNYYAKCVGADGTITDYLITNTEYSEICTDVSGDAAHNFVKVDKLYTFSTKTDNDYYTKQTVADFYTADEDDEIVEATETFTSNYRIADDYSTDNYLLAADVEYIYVDTDCTYPNDDNTQPIESIKTIVSVSKTKPSKTTIANAKPIFFAAEQASPGSKNYNVSKVFIASKASKAAGVSYIYSVGSASIFYPCKIGHTAIEDGKPVSYLYAFIDSDYLTNLKTFESQPCFENGVLKPGFYSYSIDSDGYYELELYDGEGDDDNYVVNDKVVESITGDMISAGGAYDVFATNAKIVDFSGYGLTTLAKIESFLEKGHTVRVSFWSYKYDEYKGTDKAVTTTIYVTGVDELKLSKHPKP